MNIQRALVRLGGSWGNCISYFDDSHHKIYGFKPYTLAENSWLVDTKTSEIFRIYDIEYMRDPTDQFFAKIEKIGEVKNPNNVSVEEAIKIWNEFETNRHNKLNWFFRLFDKMDIIEK